MRGKQDGQYFRIVGSGITPAGAGKTFASVLVEPLGWDHPRRCGENPDLSRLSFANRGSPPQVRGKQSDPQAIVQYLGITPAGAGKTIPLCQAKTQRQDHPRRCGENLQAQAESRLLAGSPPQVRGKPIWCTANPCMSRITPAGAGKTRNAANKPKHTRDHPRRCGENLLIHHPYLYSLGSPPQVRGKR